MTFTYGQKVSKEIIIFSALTRDQNICKNKDSNIIYIKYKNTRQCSTSLQPLNQPCGHHQRPVSSASNHRRVSLFLELISVVYLMRVEPTKVYLNNFQTVFCTCIVTDTSRAI